MDMEDGESAPLVIDADIEHPAIMAKPRITTTLNRRVFLLLIAVFSTLRSC
jgi:hypothetical protein